MKARNSIDRSVYTKTLSPKINHVCYLSILYYRNFSFKLKSAFSTSKQLNLKNVQSIFDFILTLIQFLNFFFFRQALFILYKISIFVVYILPISLPKRPASFISQADSKGNYYLFKNKMGSEQK